jgi:hypothetical protein
MTGAAHRVGEAVVFTNMDKLYLPIPTRPSQQ